MDVVVIFNGLGNQMSQYAFYLQKKKLNSKTYLISFCHDHNGLELSNVFNIKLQNDYLTRSLYFLFRLLLTTNLKTLNKPKNALLSFFNCEIIKENFKYEFNKSHLAKAKGISFYYGGWHSEEYFQDVDSTVLRKFQFAIPDDEINIGHSKHISNCNSVSIHIRRGDYLNKDNLDLFGKVCTISYYKEAIRQVKLLVGDDGHFFVFSNDLDWVKSNFIIENVEYITCNYKSNSWKDMYLMSLCKHNIIANSSFSWWGAWLNKNPDKVVICPSRFLNNDVNSDVYPTSWYKLSNY